MLRSCYKTRMAFGTDPNVSAEIMWVWAEPDANDLGVPTTFTSRNYIDKGIWPDVGEVEGAPRPWRNGSAPIPVSGQAGFCGPPEVWAEGCPVPNPAGLNLNDYGVANCCFAQLAESGQPWFLFWPFSNFFPVNNTLWVPLVPFAGYPKQRIIGRPNALKVFPMPPQPALPGWIDQPAWHWRALTPSRRPDRRQATPIDTAGYTPSPVRPQFQRAAAPAVRAMRFPADLHPHVPIPPPLPRKRPARPARRNLLYEMPVVHLPASYVPPPVRPGFEKKTEKPGLNVARVLAVIGTAPPPPPGIGLASTNTGGFGTIATLGFGSATTVGSHVVAALVVPSITTVTPPPLWTLLYSVGIGGINTLYVYVRYNSPAVSTWGFTLAPSSPYVIVGQEVTNPTTAAFDKDAANASTSAAFSVGPTAALTFSAEVGVAIVGYNTAGNATGWTNGYGVGISNAFGPMGVGMSAVVLSSTAPTSTAGSLAASAAWETAVFTFY